MEGAGSDSVATLGFKWIILAAALRLDSGVGDGEPRVTLTQGLLQLFQTNISGVSAQVVAELG